MRLYAVFDGLLQEVVGLWAYDKARVEAEIAEYQRGSCDREYMVVEREQTPSEILWCWAQSHIGEQFTAALAADCPVCEAWRLVVNGGALTGDVAHAKSPHYEPAGAGCVQQKGA